jgi:hypothetical protein
VLTFALARIVVFLIMTRTIPDWYVHVGGTHVHHLNFGIFLLAGIGAYVLLGQPSRRGRNVASVLYGIGLALTFDEFGMWLHLGGPYWQRASFDAIIVIASVLGLLSAMPSIRRFRTRHWATAVLVALAVGTFAWSLRASLGGAENRIKEQLQETERQSPL